MDSTLVLLMEVYRPSVVILQEILQDSIQEVFLDTSLVLPVVPPQRQIVILQEILLPDHHQEVFLDTMLDLAVVTL